MSAEAFLALVAKHPLPWALEDYAESAGYASETETDPEGDWGRRLVLPRDEGCMDLADAAPALAAAAIRLLRLWDTSSSSVEAEQALLEGFGPAVEALRAALPESLRE